MLNEQDKIKELETLVETISRGKYMWESTFDAITNPVMIVSDKYQILRANRAAAAAAKTDVRKMAGETCYKILAGNDQPCSGCPLQETLASEDARVVSLEPFKKNKRQYEVHSYPIEKADTHYQVVLNYRDVSEEKELQRRLLQSEKLAAIGMLAGGVAHEINNPLGGILAFAQLAMRDITRDNPVFSDLKEIEEAALRCKRIVQDLLDFSRQKSDEVMEPVQLNEVLKRIVPLIKVQARASKIQIEYQFADDLPVIMGNFHKLQQVFLNLVTNAYHAMGQTGGKLILKTSAAKGRVTAAVKDSGPGIPAEHLGKIFDPYFTTKPQGEGTGLGLSISYGIVKDHLGTIDVDTGKGDGTTFALSFPST